MKIINHILLCLAAWYLTGCGGVSKNGNFREVLLTDDFSGLEEGLISAPVGPHTEYHYLPEAGKKGNWEVTSFGTGKLTDWGYAWEIKKEGGRNIMHQNYSNLRQSRWIHPMIIAGDTLWKNYRFTTLFTPGNDSLTSGVAFRYRNSRQYYFFGVRGPRVYISKVSHGTRFRYLEEEILAEHPFVYTPGRELKALVTVQGNHLEAQLDGITLAADDNTYPAGKIGLISDCPAKYNYVEVLASSQEKTSIENRKVAAEQETLQLQKSNPAMVVWKKINTRGFGAGRNLRFGDLNMDGQHDVLIGQVIHHNAPSDSHSELSCLTAMTFDGEILWQKGTPDPEKYHLTNDVAFQIHDFNNDGRNEVIYTMNFEIIVADGQTGKTLYKTPTPLSKIPDDKFERILGDCLFFFDCEGNGFDGNLLIKDRYNHFWVMNNKLKLLWEGTCKTGHFPYSDDVNGDGKDELAIGYSLYDHDGKQRWCLDKEINDHCDGVAIADYSGNQDGRKVIMVAASDAGYLRISLDGQILLHHNIGHAQNPAIANFREDMPGLETITINFWGNQGLVHYYDMHGDIYYDFEPNQFGSMVLPLNWAGKGEEYFVHNPSVREGGVFDGRGRKVLAFPDDGHPDMCNAVLDITGDCRDEIVVWNPDEIWVYTQDNNPLTGRLYKPVRNPLYNYSNYQTTVSLPGWSE